MSWQPPYDPSDMWGAVRSLPSQLVSGWPAAKGAVTSLAPCEQVVIAGMGGSAISGDLAASLWVDELRVPVSIVRGGPLPRWVGPETIVILCSYSGDTAETLAAYEDAGRRAGRRVVITVGGELGRRAGAESVPVLPLEGGAQPRAAIGYGLTAVLAVLHACEALADPSEELRAAATVMLDLIAADAQNEEKARRQDAAFPEGEGPEERASPERELPGVVAERVDDFLPIIYVPTALGAVGRRWKSQLNENAKITAFWEEIPELNHNAVVGYEGPAATRRESVLIGLHAPSAGYDADRRLALTLDLAAEEGWRTLHVRPPIGSRVSEGLWLVTFGDLLSVHLAARKGIDPSPVELIRRLKASLASEG